MTIHCNELLKAVEIVAESKEMTATAKYSLMSAGITSATTFIGGLIAGPIGILTGATTGGLIAYSSTKNKFKSVVKIIREDLTLAQKERLIEHVQNALKDFDVTDIVKITMLLSSNEAAFMAVFNAVKMFIEGDLRMRVAYDNC